MAYRWNLKDWSSPTDPAVRRLVGEYAARVLAARGISTAADIRAFVELEAYVPGTPLDLPGLPEAVERLLLARERQERVLIWGDFDCDGVTATALLFSAVRQAGWDSSFTVPERLAEGHGLHQARLEGWVASGITLVVTVDCGITNCAEIDGARALGVEVIVIDHHSLPTVLPRAVAIVNPLRLPPEHPLRPLPGVGVAYLLAAELYRRLGRTDIESYLDLAAVGILADGATLQHECRSLVRQGLAVLARTERPGLQRLIARHCELLPPSIRDLSGRIVPRLNAVGRLDNAALAVELLSTADPEHARVLSERFETAHAECRKLVERVVGEAAVQVESSFDLERTRAIVLASPDWHPDVLGVAAARLVDRYHCPVVLIAMDTVSGLGRGLGRSLPGVNLVECLAAVAPLLTRFDGHPMAAGLAVSLDCLGSLRFALSRELASRLPLCPPDQDLHIPVVLDGAGILDLPGELDRVWAEFAQLEPFGPGNPRPLIAVLNCGVDLQISRDGRHLDCKVGTRTLRLRNQAERRDQLQRHGLLDIVFEMEHWTASRVGWWGRIRDLRPARGTERIEITREIRLEVEDCRDGRLPSSGVDLVFKEWPLLPDELATRLNQARPRLVAFAGRSAVWPVVETAVEGLVRLWEAGERDPIALVRASGLPAPLVIQLDRFAGTALSVPLLIHFVREAQAFQGWLDRAPVEEIQQLCHRLLVRG